MSGSPASRLEALDAAGALQQAGAAFRQAQALARRVEHEPEPVRALLRTRLEAAIARLEEQVRPLPAPPAAAPRRIATRPALAAPRSPIGGLLDVLRPSAGELASVGRFRDAWSAGRALEHVVQASLSRPSKAGPLNSHALVVQSLAAMQALSPAYLRRFVAQVEALQWLETTSPPPATGRRRKK